MELYSALLVLLFIEPHVFAPTDTNCRYLNLYDLFAEQELMVEFAGVGGSCDISCRPRKGKSSISSASICEQQREHRIEVQKLGMEHLYSVLMGFNHSIEIGGYWTIPNFLWNPATNTQCDFQKVYICRPEVWTHRQDVRMSCFENEFEYSNWSQQILNTMHDLHRIVPNIDTDFESLLPFPKLFNVTIINAEYFQVCPKSNPIVCHKRMNGDEDNQCSFYLCHTTTSVDLLNITFRYEPTNTLVTMSVMCHPLTVEQTKEYQTIAEEKICHFLPPQTSFFLCNND